MGKSRGLRHIIKEEGWDDATWPELHDKNLKDAREKLGDEVEEAIINLKDKTDIQERRGDLKGNSTPANGNRSKTKEWVNDLTSTPVRPLANWQEIASTRLSPQDEETQGDATDAPPQSKQRHQSIQGIQKLSQSMQQASCCMHSGTYTPQGLMTWALVG